MNTYVISNLSFVQGFNILIQIVKYIHNLCFTITSVSTLHQDDPTTIDRISTVNMEMVFKTGVLFPVIEKKLMHSQTHRHTPTYTPTCSLTIFFEIFLWKEPKS